MKKETMNKYILVILNGTTLHTERDFGECSIQELSLLLMGLKNIEKEIIDKFEDDYKKDYLITDDIPKDVDDEEKAR